MKKPWRHEFAFPIAMGAMLQFVWLGLFIPALQKPIRPPASESWSAETKAKIDPKTGNGTPWTIVWNGKVYSFTDGDGKRRFVGSEFSSYSEAALVMIEMERDLARTWKQAPKPTPEPLAKSSPSPSPSSSITQLSTTAIWTSSGSFSFAMSSPTPTPLRFYERDQAENWMTVMQIDPEKDRSWAHDNVKIETRAKPFVRQNKLTGGWTIEFVGKSEGAKSP